MRLKLALLCAVSAAGAHAQLGDKLRGLVEVDVNAPSDYDTAYVTQYRGNLLVGAVVKAQSVDVGIEPEEGEGLEYSINGMEQYGIGLDYKWLSVEALFSLPQWSDLDPALGKSKSRGFGLGITRNRLWARGSWNTTEGYFLNDPLRWTGSAEPYVRPDIKNRIFLLSVNYALSKKRRYSQRAALFQTERQKRSAGTWVAGFSGWHTTLTADSSLLSRALLDTFLLDVTGFMEAQRLILGATFGYTHTFVFWHKGFIQASLLPGLSYAQQWLATPEERLHGTGMVPVVEFKGGLGFNGDRWYCAMTAAYYYTTAQISEKVYLSLNTGHVRFALGVRFGDPRIKALKKVGL